MTNAAIDGATARPWTFFGKNGVIAIRASTRGENGGDEVVFWTGFDALHFPTQARANTALIVAAVTSDQNTRQRRPRWWMRCVRL